MSDAQQARESAAELALLSRNMRTLRAARSITGKSTIALRDAIAIIDEEHDRIIEVAADLESEGERA